ncbi:DUF975 family protein [Lacticaseibacillus hegangensis]|uniref:DUF975 family protein n=1 Tax=Lacticaseibacillus hegangensis TaxID=2486010 RepID=A0ABW4CU97_9LACO|nr:DUF975 family protein [Lacticaseibacillus hegangensis]
MQSMTHREIKHQAKARLKQPGMYRSLMLANLLPWLIVLAFTAWAFLTVWQIMQNYGLANIAANPANFSDYLSGTNTLSDQTLLQSVVMLWFTQGIAFTALDVMRGKVSHVSPLGALLKTFNSRYFFGLLSVMALTWVAKSLGFFLLVIPGILAMYGLSMSYYRYYDGRQEEQDGHPYSSTTAVLDSWRLMRGRKLNYFGLQLSLLGWQVLKLVTLHVFDFLINPYLQLVDAGFYANARLEYEVQRQMMP